MKTKVLRLLRAQDGYVSGQEICRSLEVSRTAVWKAIAQLKEEGYEIEAVQNKGYHLVSAPDVVTAEEISSRLHTTWIGHPVFYRDEIDSTNNEAKRLAENGQAGNGALIFAETQTGGKGRRGRVWVSPGGTGIWMTLLLKPDILPDQAPTITLIAAMAVAAGIRKETGLETGIKWPNDVVAGGKKICGILTEMSAEPDYINHVVVGIGINANMESFPDEIAEVADSLCRKLGHKVSRAAIAAAVWEAFEVKYEKFLQTADLSLLKEEYEALMVNLDQPVRVLDPKGAWSGIARGITETGGLLVEPSEGSDGTLIAVESGEVSVRGVYGYV